MRREGKKNIVVHKSKLCEIATRNKLLFLGFLNWRKYVQQLKYHSIVQKCTENINHSILKTEKNRFSS